MEKRKVDVALKEFWSNNERFVDLFNTVFFQGEKVLRPEEMEERDTDVSSTIVSKKMVETIERHRDVVKCAYGMDFVIMSIENQDKIHYAMPLRCRVYDDLQYVKQVKQITEKNQKEKSWKGYSSDEFLSGLKKEDRLKACFTIVIYYGESAWDGPRRLADMVEVPERLKPYFQDYPMHLLCVQEDDGSDFSHKDVRDLFYVLNTLYHNREEELKGKDIRVSEETYLAVASVQKNSKLLAGIKEEKKGEVVMCSALDRIWEDGRSKGMEEGREENRENKQKIIWKLVEIGKLSLEEIAICTDATIEEVNKIAAK